jgi:hypothetical protein
VEHIIRQYKLEDGALEVEYIEEHFGEFRNRKTAQEIIRRLKGREHLILLSMAPLPDDSSVVIPVAFKVGHELRAQETDLQLSDLVSQVRDVVEFPNRKIFYSWIGGTRDEWRGRGHLHDNRESKVFLSKKIASDMLGKHQTSRTVVEAA